VEVNSQNVTGESASERDISRKLVWFFGLGGSIAMLYYEYLWSRFALRSLATISFGGWFWNGLAIAAPWWFGLICLSMLREGAKNGKVDRDVCSKISVWVEMAVLFAYWPLTSAIQRMTSLGALK
jgi:hypothetical protein